MTRRCHLPDGGVHGASRPARFVGRHHAPSPRLALAIGLCHSAITLLGLTDELWLTVRHPRRVAPCTTFPRP